MAMKSDKSILRERYYERNLPHWQVEERDLFITFRLNGSLPANIMAGLRKSKDKDGKQFRVFDLELDKASAGPFWLRDKRVAELAAREIKKLESEGVCRVHAWVIMPNHVHLLVRPLVAIGVLTKSLKGRIARQANLLLGRTGAHFWQDESFDHWIRTSEEFARVKKYIERNPVTAGLVEKESEWVWSSAMCNGLDLAQTSVCGH